METQVLQYGLDQVLRQSIVKKGKNVRNTDGMLGLLIPVAGNNHKRRRDGAFSEPEKEASRPQTGEAV